jgi:glycine oxidase
VTAGRGADTVVIGGGVIGTAIAWRLATSGATVTLVDPHPLGGASHVAAGMLAPVAETTPGEERLLALNLAAAGRWPAFADEVAAASGVDPGYRDLGTVTVAWTRDDLALVDDLLDLQLELGLEAHRELGTALRRREPLLAPGVAGGVWTPGDHAVDTRAFGRALTEAARAAGVRTCAETAVRVETDGDRVVAVHTDTGTRSPAATVVVAAGWARIEDVPDAARIPVRPVKGQILRLRGPAGQLGTVVRAVVRGRHVYAVPRTDGRIVVGATVEERGPDTTVTAGAVRQLLDDAVAILPALDECELIEARAGLRPATPDHLPVVGPTAVDGLHVAVGHHRGGILLTPLTADVVTEAVLTGRVPDLAAGLGPDRFTVTDDREEPACV